MALDLASVDWALVLTVVSSVTTLGVLCMGFLWMRRLRQALVVALGETAGHQVRTATKLAETIEQTQKNQLLLEQQVHSLFLLYRQLKQELHLSQDPEEASESDADAKEGVAKRLH